VSTTAHTAKPAAPSQIGRFAMLRGRHPARGSGAPARSSVVAILASLCALAAGLLFATSALALNPERHYEMVSPVFKGGSPVEEGRADQAISPDGEAIAFTSPGAFNGAPAGLQPLDYLARRGASGWLTVPQMPPLDVAVAFEKNDISSSLDQIFEIGKSGTTHTIASNELRLMLHPTELADTAASWNVFGKLDSPNSGANERAASPDFCHIVLGAASSLLPEAVGTREELYEFNRGCHGESSSLALVGVTNNDRLINRKCNVGVGGEDYAEGGASAFNSVSADGMEVFFTVCVSGDAERASIPHQLFVRLGGSRTLEVSRPLEPACVANNVPGEVPCEGALTRASADFAGASEDGSKVYFSTNAPLTQEDTDTGKDLYLARIGCPASKPACGVVEREVTSLTQVSHDPAAGSPAEVQGVVRVAPDGSRVYFVAGGDLLTSAQTTGLEEEGRPVPHVGGANLYVYAASTGRTSFVGDLCSGFERSGTAEDVSCPAGSGSDVGLWTDLPVQVTRQAQTAGPDGRFLVFTTLAQLRKSDMNTGTDVYRYDAERGRLDRVSGGEGGYDANGNRHIVNEQGEVLGATIQQGNQGGKVRDQYELGNRAISEDGSRIVFTSAEPLSPFASNGLENAYEWHEGTGEREEGNVSLISSGSSLEPVKTVVISPNGVSVFFDTVDGLVPQDTDGVRDVYDARLGEGFPQPQAERRPCEGDACQGPLTNPAPLLIPGSVTGVPGDNFAVPRISAQSGKSKKRVAKKGKRKRSKRPRKRARKTSGHIEAVETSGRGNKQ
jgi:hypothetical protein